MKLPIHPRALTILWIAAWAVAFTLTHIPLEPGGKTRIPHLDKFAHVSLFFGITFLGGLRYQAFPQQRRRRALILWAIIYSGYGVIDELTQPITGRQADLDDWLFDAMGVGLATILLWARWTPVRLQPDSGEIERQM